MIKAILIDADSADVAEILWPHDPRLEGEPNWIETEDRGGIPEGSLPEPVAVAVPKPGRVMYFFEGEVRTDGALIFRERLAGN